MNIIVLTGLIFTVLQAVSTNNLTQERRRYKVPCQRDIVLVNDQNFDKHHIIQDEFDLGNTDEWKRYLEEKGLLNRTLIQSFLPADSRNNVRRICSPLGLRVDESGNLCSSKSKMLVYDVKVSNDQKITVNRYNRYVIVACSRVNNMFGDRCLPVHYERNGNHIITKRKCITRDIKRPIRAGLNQLK